jgi:zinc ribbon protein
MIRCTKCGTINKSDETFCIECNSFLEWNSEPVEDESPPGPSAAGSAAPPAPGAVFPPPPPTPPPPLSRPVYPTPPPPFVPPPLPPVAARPEPPEVGSATPDLTAPAARAPEARAPEAPPARKPTATPEEPRSRKPEKGSATPAPKPKAPEAPKVEKIKPGDRICPNCGSGNDPARKFCRRCGHSLLEAVIQTEPEPERLPWYRRIFGRRSSVQSYEAGDRPASMARASSGRRRRRLGIPNLRATVIGVMVVFGLGAYASYLYVPDVTNMTDDVIRMVRGRFTAPAPAVPVSFQGAAAQGHGAGQAFDSDNSATFWLSPPRSSADPRIDVFFQGTVDLRRFEVMGGAPGDDYSVYGRPRTIALRASGKSQEITLADTPDVQPFDIDLRLPDGEPLRIVVLDRYAGRGSNGVAVRNLVFGASG